MVVMNRPMKFKCKGCEIAAGGMFSIDEVVHDKGCMFYEPEGPPLTMRWVSVKNQLPDNAQRVLIAEYDPNYSSGAVSGEYFSDAGFVYVDAREGMRRGKDVRYWMPSPPIPER